MLEVYGRMENKMEKRKQTQYLYVHYEDEEAMLIK